MEVSKSSLWTDCSPPEFREERERRGMDVAGDVDQGFEGRLCGQKGVRGKRRSSPAVSPLVHWFRCGVVRDVSFVVPRLCTLRWGREASSGQEDGTCDHFLCG